MSNILVKGIMPALITPLDENGNVHIGSIEMNMDRNYAQGASGFYILGATGEGPLLTAEKRKTVAEAVMQCNNGRGVIINHVGAASTEEALDLARHAKRIGCDGVSSVVPNFLFKHDEDEVVAYYKRLADVAELPVIAYAQGLFTGDILSLMKRLIEVDGVVGVKYTLTDFYTLGRIKALNGGDINVINGPDEMLLCGLSMGADAGIGATYNLLCGEYCKLFNQFRAGDLSGAQSTQLKINKVVEILLRYGLIRSLKYVLTHLGIPSGEAVFPAKPLSDEQAQSLIRDLETVGYFTEYNL